MGTEINNSFLQETTYYVDIPRVGGDGAPLDDWYSVQSFSTKEAAKAFATKHFGADENGMVSLISNS